MKKLFKNSGQLQCVFSDEGITFYSPKQDAFFPYGCLDTLKMSLMGVLQAASGPKIISFAVDRKDRADMKEMVKFGNNAMKTAPKAEVQFIDHEASGEKPLVSPDLPPEEQLRQYKTLFVQGAITKEAYDAKKRLLKAE